MLVTSGQRVYLDGLADVGEAAADDGEQVVEAHHLLDEHGVHALLVRRRVLAQCRVRVEVGRQFWQDVGSHLVDDVVSRLATGLRSSGLREREWNVLFNDALNTFYLRLYGVRHMANDHSDSEKGNPLPPHRLLLSINSKGSFICIIPQTG